MARSNRRTVVDIPHHVVNRGNDRRRVFLETSDYRTFLRLMDLAASRSRVDCLAYCLMPNHFHLVLEPREVPALSAYMQWLTGSYACYFRTRTGTLGQGHVFQRRFWCVPLHGEFHELAVLRYIEANPRRAQLVKAAEMWPWSSLPLRLTRRLPIPADLSADEWKALVNMAQGDHQLARLRREVCPPLGRPCRLAGGRLRQEP